MRRDTAPDPFIQFGSLSERAVNRIVACIELGNNLKIGPWRFGSSEHLEKAMRIDPSGLSAALMIHAKAKECASQATFSVQEILDMSPKTQKVIADLRELTSLIEDEEIAHAVSEFQEKLEAAARQYGLFSKIEETIKDPTALAYLRTGALHSISHLETHQFNQGAPSPEPFHYNSYIHEFINVPSAIQAAANQPQNGVSMVLIRDPEIQEFSFFTFIVKTGETITLITDRQHFDNPEQKFKRHNPGRDLERRLENNYFPYSLLNIQVDAKDHLYIPKDPAMGRMLTYQSEPIRLKSLADIEPWESTWALMMFDLISQKYWKGNARTPELSFTGEMASIPLALHAGAHNLSLAEYKPLQLPTLTLADVTTDATKIIFRVKPTEFNRWMEDRYGPQVNPALFALKDAQQNLLLGTSAEGKEITLFSNKDENRAFFDKDKPTYQVSHLRPDDFGTRSQIERSYRWIARRNLTEAIEALAEEEYRREREHVLCWLRNAARKNLPFLRKAILAGELMAPVRKSSGFDSEMNFVERNILRIEAGKSPWEAFNSHTRYDVMLHGGYSAQKEGYLCLEELTVASHIARFEVHCPEGLAMLLGCKVTDMPVFLQHWYSEVPYIGNSILDDVDPMEEVKNPWMPASNRGAGINATIVVPFSARAKARWGRGDINFVPPEELDRTLIKAIQTNRNLRVRNKRTQAVSSISQTDREGKMFEVRINGKTKRLSDIDLLTKWELAPEDME